MPKKTKKDKLTINEQRFCECYASEKEFFGNGTQSYIEAYGIDASDQRKVKQARYDASSLLMKPHILDYINEMLESLTLNDQHVDKQLGFLISQNADKSTKLGAIKEYNNLKARIQKKLAVSINRKDVDAFLDELSEEGE